MDRLVCSGPLSLEYHEKCFATPRRELVTKRFMGCLYTDGGQIIRQSQRPSAAAEHQPADPERIIVPEDRDPRSGRALYCGHMFPMFGHIILESLARLWPVRKFGVTFDMYVFHPWEDLTLDQMIGQDTIVSCFEALGIPIERVHLVSGSGEWLSDCLIPQQLFEINHRAHALFNSLLTSVISSITNPLPREERGSGNRVYLTRLYQHRRAENEERIEAIFRRFGFHVIAPERLSFQQQVALAADAAIIAGCDGSAMHLAAFSRDATIISVDHRIVVNQYILEVLREHVAFHIWALREQISPARWMADENVISDALNSILRAHGA
jgi:capsular polysaccharide biosynthesis protein